jgi:AraC-like DNA-binding protein
MLQTMDHVFEKKVIEIFNLFTDLHHVRISLFSPEGKILYPSEEAKPDCEHCRMLRLELGLDAKCRELDQKMMHTALQEAKMLKYECHAGMIEAVAPLLVDGSLVGFVMLGQLRSELSPKRSPYHSDWTKIKGNRAIQDAYRSTPFLAEAKIETLLRLVQHMLQLIVESRLIQHRDYDVIEPIISGMTKRREFHLTLTEASRMIGRSPSSISRIFKRITGKSFKQYQTGIRLEYAASLLLNAPHKPVCEISTDSGYEDPLYFTRAFTREFGMAPTKYRKVKLQKQ